MAVEYMKTIKGLHPNHQLVDKAVKLKASTKPGLKDTTELELKFQILQNTFIDVKVARTGRPFT